MKCKYSEERLLALLKNELSDSDKAETSSHLESCEECRENYRQLEKTQSFIKKALPCNHGNMEKFNTRIVAAIKNDNEKSDHSIKRTSSRRRRLPYSDAIKIPFFTRLKKQPYFAASILLHAAAIFILVFIALKSDVSFLNNDKVSAELNQSKYMYGLRGRAVKHSISIDKSGHLDLSGVTKAKYAYFVCDYDTGSAWIYFVGGNGNFSEKEFSRMMPDENRRQLTKIQLNSGILNIPENIKVQFFKDEKDFLLVDLSGVKNIRRFELWPQKDFEAYYNKGKSS